METSTQVQGCQGTYPCIQNKRNIRIFFLTLINRMEVKKRVDFEKRPEPTREDRKINFDAYKIFYNTEVFKTEVLEVVSEVRKNVII